MMMTMIMKYNVNGDKHFEGILTKELSKVCITVGAVDDDQRHLNGNEMENIYKTDHDRAR